MPIPQNWIIFFVEFSKFKWGNIILTRDSLFVDNSKFTKAKRYFLNEIVRTPEIISGHCLIC